jgi:acetyl/propionyl-CoA carboxylase alpha subunit
VYAEDPDRGFLPSPGCSRPSAGPGGPGIRDDAGVYEGFEVPIHYDSLLSKLVAHGATRDDAIRRMRRALAEYTVLGIHTTLPFLDRVLRHDAFVAGDVDTGFVDRVLRDPDAAAGPRWDVAVAAAAIERLEEQPADGVAPAAAEGSAPPGRARAGASARETGCDRRRHRRGRTARVEVEGGNGRYRVTVDGRAADDRPPAAWDRHEHSLLVDGRSHDRHPGAPRGPLHGRRRGPALAVELAEAFAGDAVVARARASGPVR